ncbi:MAG: helix-turn-helix transcriptional regulator [Alphaproteobacteria bacterium]
MKKTKLKNNIEKLCRERDIAFRQLGKAVGLSAPQIGRVISGETKLTVELLLRISATLKVDPNDVIDVPISKKMKSSCDATLLGSIIGWLLEASAKHRIKLSRRDLGKYASFVYKEAVEEPLSLRETKYLAFATLKSLKIA